MSDGVTPERLVPGILPVLSADAIEDDQRLLVTVPDDVAVLTDAAGPADQLAGLVEGGEQLSLDLPLNVPGANARPLLRRRRSRPPSEIMAMVASFHRAFALPRRNSPSLGTVTRDLLALRTALLDEEAAEFADAANRRDLVAMADALADVVYVSFGTAVTLGIDLDDVLREVHRSNMSKLDEHGRPVLRDDGKVLKSPRYTRPDVASVLAQQLPLPFYG